MQQYRVPEETRQQILALRAKGLPYRAIARELGVPVGTAWSTTTRAGRRGSQSLRVPDEDAAQMRAQYEANPRMSTTRLARKWGWSASTVRAAIMRAGGTLRRNGWGSPDEAPPKPPKPRLFEDREAEILAWFDGGMTARQIADCLGVKSRRTVYGVLCRARRARRAD